MLCQVGGQFCMNTTVKASNVGPHGKIEPFLVKFVASLGEFCTKNEQNQLCKSKVCLRLVLSYFFCRTRFDNSKPFCKKIVQSSHEVQS